MRYSLFIVLLLFVSCKSKDISNNIATTTSSKNTNIETTNTEKKEIPLIEIVSSIETVVEDYRFETKDIAMSREILKVDIAYSGGCIKPHLFELKTRGIINEDGLMEIYLLHKTHNDLCKMMILEQRFFDLSPILNIESEKLKGLLLNDETPYYFK